MGDRAVRKDLKAYIEAELRDYPRTKAELEELRDNLLNESPAPPDGMPRGSGETSDPTLKMATRLMTDKRIRQLQLTIDAVEYVITELDPERLKMIKLKYWQRPRQLTDAGIAMELHVTERTIRRWCLKICRAIACEMGLLSAR